MTENEEPSPPDANEAGDQGGLAVDGPLTGAVEDETGGAAERIIPPEQPPMDDAAGGPQAEQDEGEQADVTASGAE